MVTVKLGNEMTKMLSASCCKRGIIYLVYGLTFYESLVAHWLEHVEKIVGSNPHYLAAADSKDLSMTVISEILTPSLPEKSFITTV